MENHAVVFLTGTGKEAGYIHQCYQWNVECVAEAYEACALARCVAVQYAGEIFGLVGNDTYCLTVEACEAHDKVLGVVALYFKEFTVVDDGSDYFVHVVRTCGGVGDDIVERVFQTLHSTKGASSRLFWGM